MTYASFASNFTTMCSSVFQKSYIFAEAAAQEGQKLDFSVTGIWKRMGSFATGVVIVMIILGLVAFTLLVERLITFIKSKNASIAFARQVAPLLATGQIEEASNLKQPKDIGYLGRVIHSGLSTYKSGINTSEALGVNPKEVVFESVARALERQSQREVQTLKRGLPVLATVGSTTPFIGLLGTVMGIVTAFQEMAQSGSGGLGSVAGGIAEALGTTALGLLVAIPAVMAYNYLQTWIDNRSVDISESSNEFLDIIAKKLGSSDNSH